MPESDLIVRLQSDMKAALKAGQRPRLDAIRMMLSEAKNADLQKPPTTPERMVDAHAKRLRKGREEYAKLGKADEVAKLDAELAVVAEYLPKQASPEATATLVAAFLAKHPELTTADAGRATGQFMKQHAGQVDPGVASAKIREGLAGR
jgi:uncharacterized protein YqeY